MEELRPLEPKPQKKPNIWKRVLAFLVTLCLLLGAVAAVAYRDRLNLDFIRRWFTYRSLEKSDSGQAAAFQFDDSGSGGSCPLGDDLLVWSNTGARIYSVSGVEYLNDGFTLASPMANFNGSSAVVYDAGGNTLRVYADRAMVFSLDVRSGHEILSARMGPGGQLAVTTQEPGYKGVVTIYDAGFQPVMAVRISTRFVTDGMLASDGNTVAVLTAGQQDNTFESRLDLYPLDGDAPFAQCSLGNEAILDLYCGSGTFWALGDGALSAVPLDGSAVHVYDYGGRYLKDYALKGDGFAALLLGKYRAGSSASLVTVDREGREVASLDMEEQVLDMDAAGRYTAVLTAAALTLYTDDLRVYQTLENTMGAQSVVLRSDGTAYLIGGETARLYIPD